MGCGSWHIRAVESDMEELTNKLLDRARSRLYNPSEVGSDMCQVAILEAIELIDSKPIPEAMLIDLAFVRLSLMLKIEPTELQVTLAKMAIKRAENITVVDGVSKNISPEVGGLSSEFD